MTICFTLTSRLIEGLAEPDPAVYRLAVADEALLRPNHWQNVLRVDRIGEELLRRLVAEELDDIEPADYADQLPGFDGGLYLETAAGKLGFECCCDLGDVAEWERRLLEQPTEWRQVWIGHPWVYARFDDEHAYISDYCETGGTTPAAPPPVRLTLEREAFIDGLRAAIAGLHGFYYLLRRLVLAHDGFENKKALLAALTHDYFAADEDE